MFAVPMAPIWSSASWRVGRSVMGSVGMRQDSGLEGRDWC